MSLDQGTLALGESYLEHFGIKGMRWGHRKAPREYSTEEGVIRKGEKLQNVSANQAVEIGDRRVFISRNVKDNATYRSTYARTLQVMANTDDIRTNTLVAAKNLKVASDKTAYDEFKKLYDQDPAKMNRALAQSYEALSRTMLGFGDTPDQKLIDRKTKAYSKKGEEWVRTKGYDLFTTGAGTNMLARDVADAYYTNLGKLGYQAIRDNTDIRAKMADDPIVILQPKGSVKLTESVPLTKNDIKLASSLYKEQKKAEKERAKAGAP